MKYKTPIILTPAISLRRYTSGFKKDQKYKETIDATLSTLSVNLGISFNELYNGLFFCKSSKSKGIIVLKENL